jgi:C-terminal processing protease CtpA/Prc
MNSAAPNPADPLDGGIPLLFHIARQWPAASDVRRWAQARASICVGKGKTGEKTMRAYKPHLLSLVLVTLGLLLNHTALRAAETAAPSACLPIACDGSPPEQRVLFDQSSTWIINQTRAFHTNQGRAVYRLPVGSAQLERLQFECNLAPYRLEFSADDTHWEMLASRAGNVASKPQEFTTQDVGFTAAQGEAAKGSGYAWLRFRPAEGSREFLQLRHLQLDVRAAGLPPGFVRPSSLPVASASSPESAKTPVYTRAEMGADLDHLTACVKRAWAYAEDKHAWLGLDVDALHAAALRELDQVHDADGFFFLVQEYVGGLMDGHAGVQAGHSSRGISTPYQWPFVVTRLDGRFYIKAIEGECGPLRPGDELLSVNGVAVRDRFETVLARSTGSTPAGREHRALGTMRWGAESQLRFEATRAGGTNFTCEMPVLRGKTAGEEPIRWKKLADHVGYLRLPSFSQDMAVWEKQGRGTNALQAALQAKKATLRQAFTELKDTRALILDVRGNGGGSDALGHFLGHFLCDTEAHPIYYSLWTRPSEDLAALPEFAYVKQMLAAASNPPGQVRLLPENGVQRYQGKLAVLMDEGCFSACDCFLNYLYVAAPQTVFVGRPNGAGAGAPRPVVTLPHSKMVITFCVMQVWNPNGQLIESRPLKPSVPVKWTVDDLRQGRDPDLEAALRHFSGH